MANPPASSSKAVQTTIGESLLDGVPPALVSFLIRLEAKIDARFDDLEDQVRTVGARLDEVTKSLRKIRRASTHEGGSHVSVTTHSQPLLSQRSADSLPSRSRSRAVRSNCQDIFYPFIENKAQKAKF